MITVLIIIGAAVGWFGVAAGTFILLDAVTGWPLLGRNPFKKGGS